MTSAYAPQPAAAELPASRQSPAPVDYRRDKTSVAFIHVTFFSILILQKFGITIGSSFMSLSLPVYLGALFLLLLRGRATVRTRMALLYFVFISSALMSTIFAFTFSGVSGGVSLMSLALLIVLYATLVLGPTRRFATE